MEARSVSARDVDKSFADTPVLRSIDLDVDPGRSLALLGPSGCGKTTLLRLIAGLDRPDNGEILIGGDVMVGAGVWTPPEKRNVGMVFQDWALFPHLNVGRNVAYGLERAERSGPHVGDALEMVGLRGLEDRMPQTLSGGQQQRVALARALAPRPTVLLLDEPFSNLDAALRVGVRTEVHRLLTDLEITSIFVTHDQEEAFVLGDQVAVMRHGRIEQVGSPRDIYRTPDSAWVASFVGDVNILDARATGERAETSIGFIPLRSPQHGPCQVLLRPEDLRLSSGGEASITLTEYYGPDMMVSVSLGDLAVQVRVPAHQDWTRGDLVTVSYVGESATAFV